MERLIALNSILVVCCMRVGVLWAILKRALSCLVGQSSLRLHGVLLMRSRVVNRWWARIDIIVRKIKVKW